MQSKQKRIKWSRGETSTALEERTDTGITQVSVAQLQNIIADIYGNIQRRPALKVITTDEETIGNPIGEFAFQRDDEEKTQTFVFSVTESEYIIFIVTGAANKTKGIQGFHIKDNKFVKKVEFVNEPMVALATDEVSAVQSNNYMVIGGLSTSPIVFKLTEDNKIQVEDFKYNAPWLAVNGTQMKTLHAGQDDIPPFEFNKNKGGFATYLYTDTDTNTVTSFSWIDTGLSKPTYSTDSLKSAIPVGSILHLPNIGCYMRVEGYAYYTDATKIYVYGTILTNVADQSKTDTMVDVEYGYVNTTEYFPQKFAFAQQRLYATHFKNTVKSPQVIPSFIVGSQIAKYTDFKNDYGAANEAVTININTTYQEQMISLIDFNGIKIFSDAAEYTYDQTTGIKKQSENGIYNKSKPVIFKSMLLYADKTKKNIMAFNYDLGQDIYKSAKINQLTAEDLIYDPWNMTYNEDREHFTGTFLYVLQSKKIPQVAVCTLSPETNNMIWSRWIMPTRDGKENLPLITGAVAVRNKVWFVVKANLRTTNMDESAPREWSGYTLAELDFEKKLDFETELKPTDEYAYLIKPQETSTKQKYYAWKLESGSETYFTLTEEPPAVGEKLYQLYALPTGLQHFQGTEFPFVKEIINSTTIVLQPIPTSTEPKTYIREPSRDTNGENFYAYTRTEDGVTVYFRTNTSAGYDLLNVRGTTNPDTLEPYYTRVATMTEDMVYFSDMRAAPRNRDLDRIQKLPYITLPNTTIQVYDGDKYMWNDTTDEQGKLTKSIAELQHPKIGFEIDAELVSHPIDINGKTRSIKKRIAKVKAVTRNTDKNAFTINEKYGYTNNEGTVNFYGVTGMKDIIQYTIKNKRGAKFTIESLALDLEYATLD